MLTPQRWHLTLSPSLSRASASIADRSQLGQYLALVLAGSLLAVVVVTLAHSIPVADRGVDYRFYVGLAQRFLEGDYYLPHQLAGPYQVGLMVDSLYPPNALFLFVPFLVLPAVLWWAVPIGVTLYVIRWLKPSPLTLAVMLVLLSWPRAIGAYFFGNTDMWVCAFVAAGIRWGWPAVFIMLKPTFAPLALLGVRKRSWWVAAIVFGVASLLMLPLWFQYVTAMRGVAIGWDYSLGSLPLVLIPVVAWSRRTRPSTPFPLLA